MPPLPSIASINRSSKCHVPFLAGIVSPYDQFKHNSVNFIKFALMTTPEQKEAMDKTYEIVDGRTKEVVLARDGKVLSGEEKGRGYTGLKKIAPYWYPYTTMTKMRWIGRELLEVVSTEFRDRSMEYYVSGCPTSDMPFLTRCRDMHWNRASRLLMERLQVQPPSCATETG